MLEQVKFLQAEILDFPKNIQNLGQEVILMYKIHPKLLFVFLCLCFFVHYYFLFCYSLHYVE